MEKIKKIAKSLLYPHKVVAMILFPLSMAFLIFSMLYFGMEHIISYTSYALAFYSLTITCLRIPQIIGFFRKIKDENKYIVRYRDDTQLRINISLYSSLIINIIYSIFQLCLGLYHKSFWYYSMAIYYILLSLMRFYLVKYTKNNKGGEQIIAEYKRYNFCGWMMLLMNLAITGIMFFIIYFDRTFYHHPIITIAMATYTFTTFSLSIHNFVKYRKYNSPVYSAAKLINLVAGCVSMMTLSTTMLTVFGGEENPEFRKILLTIVGIVISLFILATVIQIIVVSKKKIKELSQK